MVILGFIPTSSHAPKESRVSKKTISIGSVRQTSDEGELFLENLFKLSFRDTIPVENDAFGGLVGLFLFEVGSVIDEFRDHILRDNKLENAVTSTVLWREVPWPFVSNLRPSLPAIPGPTRWRCISRRQSLRSRQRTRKRDDRPIPYTKR